MAVFPFPYFTLGEAYPESSTKVRFGRGYTFGSAPKGPDQIMFVLKFDGLWFYQTYDEEDEEWVVDAAVNPTINMKAYLNFYETHKTYTPFDFVHPFRGTVSVKFDKPAEWELVKNGRGLVAPFEVRLELQP